MNKVMSLERFVILRQTLAQKIVLVGGCFDIFHFGHLTFLSKAKQQGESLVVLLESDKAIRARKKHPPFHSQQERATILAALECIDYVIPLKFLNSDEDYSKIVMEIKPSIVAVTVADPQMTNKQQQASKIGAEVVVVTPLIKKFSSSKIKNYAPFSGN